MARTRISVELLDADGCLYNAPFLTHLHIFAQLHGDFLKSYAEKIPLNPAQMRTVSARMEQIRKEIREGYRNYAHSNVNVGGAQVVDTLLSLTKLSVELDNDDEDVYLDMLLDFNQDWLCSILGRQTEFDQLVLMVGSQRQCDNFDKRGMMMNGTGSIFIDLYRLKYAFKSILTEKKVSVNRLTVTDLQYQRDVGETFSKILEHAPEHDIHIFDRTKLSILYGAIHHIAVIRPSADIVVNFYDDLRSEFVKERDILLALQYVFSSFPQLIPFNVTLKLHHYDGALHSIETIAGKGVIDYRYKENVQLMTTMCGHGLKNDNIEMDVAHTLDVEEFLSRRVTGTELVLYGCYNMGLFFSPQCNRDNLVCHASESWHPVAEMK